MNINISKKILLFILVTFIIGCNNNTTGPSIVENATTISDICRIIWTLESFQIDNMEIDLSNYLPFNLLFDDSTFLGDDGCDKYSGYYEIHGDTLVPKQVGKTLLCDGTNLFPLNHLITPYRYKINLIDSEIALYCIVLK